MRKTLAVVVPLFALLILPGCAKSLSSQIGTSEIYVLLTVLGNSLDKVTCKATFKVGGGTGTYIELDGEDKAACGDGSTEVTLSKSTDFLGVVSYEATGLTYNTARTYTVSLKRKNNESFDNTTTLPGAVNITAPTAGATHQKGTALPFTWGVATSNGLSVELSWSTSNASSVQSRNTNDDGTDSLTATETQTKNSDSQTVTGNIPATIKLTRTLNGSTVATGLKGGTITGEQEKSVAITLVD